MTRWQGILTVGLGGLGILIGAHLSLQAQDRPRPPLAGATVKAAPIPIGDSARAEPVAVSVQDALLRPLPLPFGQPTSLGEVCGHLGRILRAPVVLDKAALDRKNLTADDTVQLELDGVRLKTGLKLLFDQVGLTYRVVPEDNLLIVTDAAGSDDPLDRLHAELRALHLDLHDLQDTVDDLREQLGVDASGPRVRKPTIIEEMPDEKAGPGPKPDAGPPGPDSKPGTGGNARPRPGA